MILCNASPSKHSTRRGVAIFSYQTKLTLLFYKIAFIIGPFLGPSLGTLTGAYIISEYDNNWRWGLWVIMIICAPIAVMACFLKETSRVRILFLREQKRGVKVQHQEGDTKILIHKLRRAIARPVKMFFVEVSL